MLIKLGGKLLDQTSQDPFLKTAVTRALDQSNGEYITLIYDSWTMKESHVETGCETSFMTLAGISSGPHGFLGFNWNNSPLHG